MFTHIYCLGNYICDGITIIQNQFVSVYACRNVQFNVRRFNQSYVGFVLGGRAYYTYF